MDARLTDEQRRVQRTVADFFESSGGTELARRRMEGDVAVVDELWSELADLGYTAITVPVEYGGFGEGSAFLATFLEVAGRYAAPVPIPETAAFAVPVLLESGTDAQRDRYLPGIADGDLRFSFALYDDEHEPLPESIRMRAEPRGDAFRLEGTKVLVPFGGEVDRVVVAARTRDAAGYEGVSLFVVDPDDAGVDARHRSGLDRSRPTYELTFDGVELERDRLLGPLHGGGRTLVAAADRFTVAICAMLVGAADRAVELSAEYGRERTQYGHPIGRFQAVKHRIVDMWVDMQSARSLVYYAAWALDGDEPDATRAVASTKAFAADRLHRVFADDVLNHGGAGFTWDHDAHIYLKQAKAWRNFLGSPETHRDRLLEARLRSLEERSDD